MASTISIRVKEEVMNEFSKLSKEKRILLNTMIYNQAQLMNIQSAAKGILSTKFLFFFFIMTVLMVTADRFLLGEASISASRGGPFTVAIFAMVSLTISFYRTYKSSVVAVTTLKEGHGRLVTSGGDLFFVIECYNRYTKSHTCQSFWTGERRFWEDLKEEQEH